MNRLEWLPAFETGIAEIDEDHRRLFSLAREIGETAARRDAGFNAKLREFLAAAEAHFAREEEILDRLGFPNLVAHRDYHASLLAEAERLRKACEAKADHRQFAECYSELVDFLIDDIVRGDTQFKSYLNHRGLTPRDYR